MVDIKATFSLCFGTALIVSTPLFASEVAVVSGAAHISEHPYNDSWLSRRIIYTFVEGDTDERRLPPWREINLTD